MIQSIYTAFLNSSGISTDSRKIKQGQIFFALSGANFNGNLFAKKALENGADFVVIETLEDDIDPSKYFLVKDCLETLQNLANHHRRSFDIPVIAITGSNGKTTTKELLAHCLEKKFEVLYTKGNFNNHIGVPLTLLNLSNKHEIAIIEMGANHLDEIALLCTIAMPTHGFITNIGLAHIEGFGSIGGILKGKSELYDFLDSAGGIIFYNDNDKAISENIESYKTDKINVFESLNIYSDSGFLGFQYGLESIVTNMIGSYNIDNIVSSLNMAKYFGVTEADILNAISDYRPNMNRSQRIAWGNCWVVLDAYNANPSSMRVSLLSFNKTEGTKYVVLGDMFELGIDSKAMHIEIADLAQSLDFDGVYFIGEKFYEIKEQYTNSPNMHFYLNKEGIADVLSAIPDNANILVKGSRAMKLEQLFEDF